MIRKTRIVIFAIPIIVVFLALGVVSGNFSEEEITVNETSSIIQNGVMPQAFAEKPTKTLIPITVDEHYGDTSLFDMEEVICQTSTKEVNGITETKVNWCKATAIKDDARI